MIHFSILNGLGSIVPVVLAAQKVEAQTLIFIGMLAAVLISLLTYSNWRMGVKIAFVVVLFEGAIRKWVIPGFQELAYFGKDLFLVGAYLRFFMFPDPDIRAKRLRLPTGVFLLCAALVSFSALNPNIGSSILAAYGIKIYLFYLPLVYMLPYLFKNLEDLEKNLFWYAMLATPICLLGIAQSALPGDSFLNVYAQGGEGSHMGWEGSKVRVTGTFSYISGHTTFLIIFFALHLALLVNKISKWKWICLIFNLPLLGANVLMNGSRTTLFVFVLIGGALMLISMFMKIGNGGNIVLKIGFLSVIVIYAVSAMFGAVRSDYSTRMKSADDGVYYRVIGMPLGAVQLALNKGGLYGYGIGMTHPALERLRSAMKIPKPRNVPPTYDNEIGQILLELGIIGWAAWYTLRLILLYMCFVAFRDSPPGLLKSLSLVSLLVQMPHFLLGVVLNHTANFLVFGMVGLAVIPLLQATVQRRFQSAGSGNRLLPVFSSPKNSTNSSKMSHEPRAR